MTWHTVDLVAFMGFVDFLKEDCFVLEVFLLLQSDRPTSFCLCSHFGWRFVCSQVIYWPRCIHIHISPVVFFSSQKYHVGYFIMLYNTNSSTYVTSMFIFWISVHVATEGLTCCRVRVSPVPKLLKTHLQLNLSVASGYVAWLILLF